MKDKQLYKFAVIEYLRYTSEDGQPQELYTEYYVRGNDCAEALNKLHKFIASDGLDHSYRFSFMEQNAPFID